MAESTGLLNLHTGNRITSSNLVLSAQCNQQADAAPFWCGIFVSGRAARKARFPAVARTRKAASGRICLLIAPGQTEMWPAAGRANLAPTFPHFSRPQASSMKQCSCLACAHGCTLGCGFLFKSFEIGSIIVHGQKNRTSSQGVLRCGSRILLFIPLSNRTWSSSVPSRRLVHRNVLPEDRRQRGHRTACQDAFQHIFPYRP